MRAAGALVVLRAILEDDNHLPRYEYTIVANFCIIVKMKMHTDEKSRALLSFPVRLDRLKMHSTENNDRKCARARYIYKCTNSETETKSVRQAIRNGVARVCESENRGTCTPER